jgi:flagellar basal body-associated protein FliL
MTATSTTSTQKSSKLKWIFIPIVIIALVMVVLYFIFNYTYSEGNRAGVLIKFSKKGYVFKTFEGELNIGGMGNIPNTAQMNQLWDFSVRNRDVADSLMKLEGKKVSLHYNEVVKNFIWDGETKYFVDGVKVLE